MGGKSKSNLSVPIYDYSWRGGGQQIISPPHRDVRVPPGIWFENRERGRSPVPSIVPRRPDGPLGYFDSRIQQIGGYNFGKNA